MQAFKYISGEKMQDIIVLNIKFHFGQEEEIIHPVVLRDDESTVLVDCGFVKHLDALEKAFHKENIKLQDIDKVLVTHHDYDHIGCLKELKDKNPNIKILSSEKEADYIQGKKQALRLQQAKILKNIVEEKQKEELDAFIRNIERVEKVNVDEIIKNGDIVPVCGGCTVIETPGHTKGGVCFLVDNMLFSGDTLFCCSVGRTDFPGSDPHYMMQSLQMLNELEGNYKVYPGHNEFTDLDYERRNNPYMKPFRG